MDVNYRGVACERYKELIVELSKYSESEIISMLRGDACNALRRKSKELATRLASASIKSGAMQYSGTVEKKT